MSRPTARARETFALVVADVFDLAGVLRRYGERIAATAGQTQARWQLMSVVSVGDWTVPMAADRLGTSRQAVQRLANELVDDGLARFADNPRHRRSPFLRLTANGQGVLDVITDRAGKTYAGLHNQVDRIDLDDLRQTLQDLTSAIRSEFE